MRFATDQRRPTTLRLLAECFEAAGGVPAVVLSDRMECLKATTVAGLVVPHPDYVRFAAHYGFRPDFCEPADPESKGMVESLVGYAKSDLVVGLGPFGDVADANEAAPRWCEEVNGRLHSEIQAVPAERLEQERELLRPLPRLRPQVSAGVERTVNRLSTVRFGSARYSVPVRLVGSRVRVLVEVREVVIFAAGVEVARHRLIAPGEVSISDEHYGGSRIRPVRAVRPRSASERAFLGLGGAAEDFLHAAAAAGTPRLASEIEAINGLGAAWGPGAVSGAIGRALAFRRFTGADVASILQAGGGVPSHVEPGEPIRIDAPDVPVRELSDYALEVLG